MNFEEFKKDIIAKAVQEGCVKINEKSERVFEFMYRKFQETGNAYCPCQSEKTKDTICPCVKFREENHCCCSLFEKGI